MPAASKHSIVQIEGKDLKLSNLDKILYPASGTTKAEVIDYYVRIAPVLMTHLKNRPLTLKRYPNGVAGEFFYEKQCPAFRPSWMKTCHSSHNKDHPVHYCVANSTAALVWIANLASIELHTMLSDIRDITKPTFLVFDLDPGPTATVLDCVWLAGYLKKMFARMKLKSFPKTSGGKGLHIAVPLNTPVTYDQTKNFAKKLAQLLEQQFPDKVTSAMKKASRHGRIFVDWSQNVEHKTTVCAYSLRARERPTVSTPVSWEELERAAKKNEVKALIFEMKDVLKRVEKLGDLYAPVASLKQKLPKL
jgi:bifunctional non-homologous end joining protein LigD